VWDKQSVRNNERMTTSFEIHRLDRRSLTRVGEIDRTEHIEALYVQDRDCLIKHKGSWDASPWDRVGNGEHSVAARVSELNGYLDRGGIVLGALVDGHLIGIGVVIPRLRNDVAQLAFLHVSFPWRNTGVGSCLSTLLDNLAREAGASVIVVSATPTGNTINFYRHRGFTPMASPLEELATLEPDDIHMHKRL
jgi:GNAT superfamily N-acetyltransferase